MLRTGSVAQRNSSVPTQVDARKGVKEKYELGETTVTVSSSAQLEGGRTEVQGDRVQTQRTIVQVLVNLTLLVSSDKQWPTYRATLYPLQPLPSTSRRSLASALAELANPRGVVETAACVARTRARLKLMAVRGAVTRVSILVVKRFWRNASKGFLSSFG
jgi:cytochrome c-type biogenesis protein CcmH/NrfG